MTDDSLVASLKAQHAELEEALKHENERPLPNPVTVSDLKKQKLRIKDQLAGIDGG